MNNAENNNVHPLIATGLLDGPVSMTREERLASNAADLAQAEADIQKPGADKVELLIWIDFLREERSKI